ncbi:MAG: flippase-like domain-containing protein [Alphaproteobacteria bacterium]|nr:flippase-like domain-containing protein [Alphaproteobacteria bacterium]
MRRLKYVYLALGIGLLAVVATQVDVPATAAMVGRVGWGLGVLLGIYFLAFAVDSLAWQIAQPEVPLNPIWAYRMWKVRMVGEVCNNLLPAGGMGGEPLKAVLMHKHYGLSYTAVTASLLLTKTVNMIALVLFLTGGFILMSDSALPNSYKMVSGLGLGSFALAILLFFVIQRLRLTSGLGLWLSRTRFGRGLGDILHHIHATESRLVTFYSRLRLRFVVATALGFVNWMLGVAEIYYAAQFLGHPVSVGDAWIIEAAVQLLRAGAFFIPAGLGAQEGLFVMIFAAMTGVPTLGAAVAVVRRLREGVWIGWGLAVGLFFSRKNKAVV